MKLLDKTDFETINKENLKNIIIIAQQENEQYYNKTVKSYIPYSLLCYQFANKDYKNYNKEKALSKRYSNQNPIYNITTHTSEIINSKKYNFNTQLEKELFKINTIFPNDKDFLEKIKNSGYIELLNDFIEKYTYFDESTEKRIKKQLFLNTYSRKKQTEINNLLLYFKKFYGIDNFKIIINRYLQVYYTNSKLYNNYINEPENEKILIKK